MSIVICLLLSKFDLRLKQQVLGISEIHSLRHLEFISLKQMLTWKVFFTSTILFFWLSLTFPARQQRERALWMMNLFDLKLGSLNSLGPEKQPKYKKKCLVRSRADI